MCFLHIPKTAGSSFRAMLYEIHGKNSVFWYGIDIPQRKTDFNESEIAAHRFVGGHKQLSYYPRDAQNLYCALLRRPVDRVVSLYSYYSRPAAASDDKGRARRSDELAKWVHKGLDPTSIVNTIHNCPAFRNAIENFQCRYLSYNGNTFEGVLKAISDKNILIGDSDQIGRLTESLCDLLNWPTANEAHTNVSVAEKNIDILQEPGAVELIKQFTMEDELLYQYLHNEHNGQLENIIDIFDLANGLSYTKIPTKNRYLGSIWPALRLHTADRIPLVAAELAHLKVTIENTSDQLLNPKDGRGIFLNVIPLDKNGQTIPLEIVKTQLKSVIPANGNHSEYVKVLLPENAIQQTISVVIKISVPGEFNSTNSKVTPSSEVILIKPGWYRRAKKMVFNTGVRLYSRVCNLIQ